MSLQTAVFRDGEWVTETVGLHTVLKSLESKPSKKPKSVKAPTCGLLTRTVVETELAHYILPVRLRSSHHNDVAFVGDYYVQIRELHPDGQLQNVLRRNDFGSRIRNATVIGSVPDSALKGEKNDSATDAAIKAEDVDVLMDVADDFATSTSPTTTELPPQMLVLALECGDTVFLWIRAGQDGRLEFEHSRFATPTSQLVPPGFHMAVDPSSRYLALGCAERSFVVYQLDALKSLQEQYRLGEPLSPVVSYRVRSVQGVVHQMQFLYPTPGYEQHIILLLIIVKDSVSNMVIYEWQLGDKLKDVFADEKHGYKMAKGDRVPLLVIPLTVNSAFITISEDQITVYSGHLHGPPEQYQLMIEDESPPTASYHGRNKPLWTAWARPFRMSEFLKTHDCLYLAREDGVVYLFETDSDTQTEATLYMEKFDCSISTAFTCLYDQYSDVLVMGGDSSPGAIWKAAARERFVQLGSLPNWSPVLDFTTTDEFPGWNSKVGAAGSVIVPWQDKIASTPDRVFSTSGRGKKGTVTEYRYGLQAKIGLEFEFDFAAKQAFMVPAHASSQTPGYDLLLSMPDHTTALRVSEDLNDVSELSDPDSVKYDVLSRTLTVVVADDKIVQVTEQNIVLLTSSQVFRYPAERLGSVGHVTIFHTAVCHEYIAVSTNSGLHFQLHVLRVEDSGGLLGLTVVKSYDVAGEVTCLSLCGLDAGDMVLQAGVCQQERLAIARAGITRASGATPKTLELLNPYDLSREFKLEASSATMEPIDSIASCFHNGELCTVIGFRNGLVLTFVVTKHAVKKAPQAERLGTTAAKVTVASQPGDTPMVLVSSDSRLALITDFDSKPVDGTSATTTKHFVWPVDVKKPAAVSPPVDSVTVLPKGLLSDRDNGNVLVLLISGRSILFAELELQPGPAHRHIPVNGTPTRILYSHHLKCLVVAVIRDTKPTLVFLDPDTGDDIGKAMDRTNKVSTHARGLGKSGDKIHSMVEWPYERGDNAWYFLLLGMHLGRMIVISAQKEKVDADSVLPPMIRYWSRFQKKDLNEPVYSVLGYRDSIVYCVGREIRWDSIMDKKLRQVSSFEIGSPVASLSVVNGSIMALTVDRSIEILDRIEMLEPQVEQIGQLVHSDPRPKRTLHMIDVAASNSSNESLTMVSDWGCGVSGLWTPWHSKGKDCELVFEAELRASIRRFVRGRTRPTWEQGVRQPVYGRIAMTVDDAEVLGVCMDGSVVQFQLLNTEVWRLLCFIQNIARLDRDITPFNYSSEEELEDFSPEPVATADRMHIDGDVLQRIVQARALERLLAKPAYLSRFRELLDDMDDGRLTDELADNAMEGDGNAGYIGLAYRIMKHFMTPAL